MLVVIGLKLLNWAGYVTGQNNCVKSGHRESWLIQFELAPVPLVLLRVEGPGVDIVVVLHSTLIPLDTVSSI